MSVRPLAAVPLGDLLALAIIEHGSVSGSALALHVAARKDAVLAELRSNARFEQLGSGRGSRWRLAARSHHRDAWEPQGTDSGACLGIVVGANGSDRLAALERRVARLERVLAERGVSAT